MTETSTPITETSRGLLDPKSTWFIPWNELNDLDNIEHPDKGNLRKVDSEFEDADQFVEAGQPFTISLESFVVHGAHDSDNTNDLLVRSFVRYGKEPKTETIHFFGTDVEAGAFQENLESEHVFAQREFVESARLWLTFEILEIDRGLDRDHSIAEALKGMRGQFGAIFPALIPFAPVAGVALGMVDRLRQLERTAAKNEPVFRNTIDFNAKALAGGDAPLRYGAYVLFNEDVQGIQYRLGSGFKLRRRAMRDRNVPILHDYIIVKITPGIIESRSDSDDLLTNQKIAAVVSNLDDAEADKERRELRFSFLKNMVEQANHFKDLSYYHELMTEVELGETLSQVQKKRLIDIKKRLGHLLRD